MFTHYLTPRLNETDALGHISNTRLPSWFEEARRELFCLFNPSLRAQSWNLILRKYEIEILNQMDCLSEVKIETHVLSIGNKSFTTLQSAFQNGQCVATAMTVLVYFDFDSQRSANIPPKYSKLLQDHLIDNAA